MLCVTYVTLGKKLRTCPFPDLPICSPGNSSDSTSPSLFPLHHLPGHPGIVAERGCHEKHSRLSLKLVGCRHQQTGSEVVSPEHVCMCPRMFTRVQVTQPCLVCLVGSSKRQMPRQTEICKRLMGQMPVMVKGQGTG